MDARTKLQKEADAIDCDLDRIARRLVRLADESGKAALRRAYRTVDAARSDVRQFMHEDDRKATSE